MLLVQLITFQAVIATDGRRSYTIYNYANIQWTTGDASGKSNGFGGTVARASNNAGVGGRHVTLSHSGNQGQMLAFEHVTYYNYILQAQPLNFNVHLLAISCLHAHLAHMHAIVEFHSHGNVEYLAHYHIVRASR